MKTRQTFDGYYHFFKWNHNFSNTYDSVKCKVK